MAKNLVSRIEAVELAVEPDRPPHVSFAARMAYENLSELEQARQDAAIAAWNAWHEKKYPGSAERMARSHEELHRQLAEIDRRREAGQSTGAQYTSSSVPQLVSNIEGPGPHSVKHEGFFRYLSAEAQAAELADEQLRLNPPVDKLKDFRAPERTDEERFAFLQFSHP